MKRTVLFFSIILSIPYLDAMKRPRTSENEQRSCIKRPTAGKFNFPSLPPDMQDIIFDFATINTTYKKPRFAARTINYLSRTNKALYAKTNDLRFNDELIAKLSRKFFCSHETIAWYLGTPASQTRLSLQYELQNLFSAENQNHYNYNDKRVLLNQSLAKGAKLDFTYNYKTIQKTPLMICASYSSDMTELLLEKKANINESTSHGWTVLMITVMYPICDHILRILLKQPDLTIDQRNNLGETALLRCLSDRKKFNITPSFKKAIRSLLDANADPEIFNKNGLTPLKAAQSLGDPEVIALITNAIEKKHAQAQQ